jgi:hypothetical protein
MVSVGTMVAQQCDAYGTSAGLSLACGADAAAVARELPSYRPWLLSNTIVSSLTCKVPLQPPLPPADRADAVTGAAAALLCAVGGAGTPGGQGLVVRLAPRPRQPHRSARADRSLCSGADGGAGLTSAMFLNEQMQDVPCPDPEAGLYIRDRAGKEHRVRRDRQRQTERMTEELTAVQVTFEPSQVAFQIGESSQIHTGGLLVATPHCVRVRKDRKQNNPKQKEEMD